MTPIQDQLIKYLEDAHALEQHVEKALEGMISSAPDFPELQDPLRHHLEETKQHKQRLEERLSEHGASPSRVKDAGMIFAALGKGIIDKLRKDNAGKVARDGFVAEHLEIAAYELLERVAARAGDQKTVEVARLNKADELAMAEKINASWDLALDLSFKQEGIEAPPITPPQSPVGAATPEATPQAPPPEQHRVGDTTS